MRRNLLLLATIIFSTIASAQAPFVVYKPVITPERSFSIPNFSFPDPFEEKIRENNARAAARARAMEIVSSDIVTVDGFNYINNTSAQLKIKIIQRRSGHVEFQCLGIKKNGAWKICEKEIISLEEMYKAATKESDKTTILELMEHGNFLLIVDINSEVYIIQ